MTNAQRFSLIGASWLLACILLASVCGCEGDRTYITRTHKHIDSVIAVDTTIVVDTIFVDSIDCRDAHNNCGR